jgi:hypothetical protein
VRFLAIPHENRILIEKASADIPDSVVHTWLFGTVMAYILQYHGKLVLHGSAVLMNGRAVIFSGQSGAGKSTLANALVQRGYPFITDDLVVIQKDDQGQYGILPGPPHSKLWKDAMLHLNQNIDDALPISLKVDKYAFPVAKTCNDTLVPIAAFYELNPDESVTRYSCEPLPVTVALKTLMQNVYRYFMLKPLGKLPDFFRDCSALSQHITAYKVTRSPHFHDLENMIKHIEINQGMRP